MNGVKNIIVGALMVGMMGVLAGCGNSYTPVGKSGEVWGQADATEMDLISKIPGYVVEMSVEEGAHVEKGQIIARVDSKQLDLKRSQAVSQVSASQAQVSQAAAGLEMAAADGARFAQLYEQDAVSRQVYEAYQTKYKVAQATYAQAQAAVAANAETIELVAASIDDTEIKAPYDGVVTTKYVESGALVSTGMPIYGVQNPISNWVNFKIPETKLQDFQIGQEVKLVGRNSDLELDGVVVDISSKPEFATKRATSERSDARDIISFNVKVRTNSELVRPGMRFRLKDYVLDEGEY